MDTQMKELLEEVVSRGTPTYVTTAREILDNPATWTNAAIKQFLDSFLNDPYLFRNEETAQDN